MKDEHLSSLCLENVVSESAPCVQVYNTAHAMSCITALC